MIILSDHEFHPVREDRRSASRTLMDTMGEGRVTLGSDLPRPLGESPVGSPIEEAGLPSGTARTEPLGGDAARVPGR
ncbi:hypothetical protein ACQPYK_46675 [Streptosporangium sp. CA-135522]|uniref:hypothetical protein n=1 Tax=Streptosporangium sp. CA-135522 TaxID=3240072 RepID=UPI003D9502A0